MLKNLSFQTAFIVVVTSLFVSKYLAEKGFSIKQPSLLASEASLNTLASQKPSTIDSLKRHAETIQKQTEYLNRQKQNLEQQTEALERQSRNLGQIEKLVSTSATQSPQSLTVLEQEVFVLINEYRRSQNLPSLVLDSRISQQARNHSQAMASGQVPFSDEGFDLRADIISREIPYQGICENVAYNLGFPNPARVAVNNWLRNPKHNTIDPAGQYDLTGIGVATNLKGEYYFTQIFVRRQ